MNSTKLQTPSQSQAPFGIRAVSALGVSVVADALDYLGAPIFALPIIGDIADGIVMGILYRLTGSKKSALIHAIEFIPFVGDFVPTYTITTLAWILREIRKRSADLSIVQPTATSNSEVRLAPYSSAGDKAAQPANDDLTTTLMRAYAVVKSRLGTQRRA